MSETFVGRESELAALSAVFAAALAGQGQLMLVAGEPGIGKTRLLEEFASVAQQQAALFWGRCWEGDGTPAFWPWVQIVRAYVSGSDPLTLLEEVGSGAADIAQIVPEVRKRLPQLPMPLAIDPEYARFRFFDGIASFLRNAARRHPLVLLFDDLHWADTSSLRLLHFLARELRQARILMVGAYRDVEVAQSEALSAALGDLIRESQRLELGGLSRAELALFMTQASNTTPTDTLVNTLHEQTNGNPFFINEMVRLFLTEGRLQSAERGFTVRGGLPLGVRETIRRRLARLSTSCRQMLAVAAVVGRDFRLEILRQVEFGPDVNQDKELLPLLDEALGAQLIDQKSETISHYRFIHALVRETLYEDLPLPVRVALHERVGAAIERLCEANLEPHLAELADHFFKALPKEGGEVKEKAVQYAIAAGDRATTILAYEEALNHYEHALQALTLTQPDEPRRCQVLLRIGEAQHRTGATKQARETYTRAAALAHALGAHSGNKEAAHMLAYAALGIAGHGDLATRYDKVMTDLLEEALRVITDDEMTLRVRLLSRSAIALYFMHTPEHRDALSREAVALARQVGDPATLAYALNAQHYALWGPDHVEERLAIAKEIVGLSEMTGVKEMALSGHILHVLDLLDLGEIAALDRELRMCTELMEELRQPYYRWRVHSLRTMRTLLAGQFAEAEQLAQETLALGQHAQTPNAFMIFSISHLALSQEQGRLRELEEPLKDFVERYPAISVFRTGLAFLYCEIGKDEEARAEFEKLAMDGFDTLPRDGTWMNGYEELAQTCAFLEDEPRAALLYDTLLPYAGRNVVVGFADGCHGPVSRYLGLLAATMSRWDEAERHFTDAITMNIRMGARPFMAHTQHDYACMLWARNQPGDKERAHALLEAAQETAQQLGMTRLQEKITALRKRIESEQQTSLTSATPSASANAVHFDGKRWTLKFAGQERQQRNSKGLRYLVFLLQTPHREWHVLDLLALTDTDPEVTKTSVPTEVFTGQLTVRRKQSEESPPLDAQARAAYRRRLEDLQAELEEAEAWHDAMRATKAREEMDVLAAELANAYGTARHARARNEDAEKARKAVTNRIRDALTKLQSAHPLLWRHLFAAIKTGTFCSYQPAQPTQWTF